MAFPAFVARPLTTADRAPARALAAAVGVHGVYVGNYLSRAFSRGASAFDRGEVVALCGEDGLLGIAYFGGRGNLVLIQREALDGAAVAEAVRGAGFGWRIALGPDASLRALAEGEPRPPTLHRRQVYYAVRPQDVPAALMRADVRRAERRDHALLLESALDLNASDLHIDSARVHRPWLRDAIRRRVQAGQTFVLGEPGRLVAKLDVGSDGPFGLVVEGVYTLAEQRGRGLATGLVATVARRAAAPLVCLHVAEGNAPARRAYERAGMRQAGECALVLRA